MKIAVKNETGTTIDFSGTKIEIKQHHEIVPINILNCVCKFSIIVTYFLVGKSKQENSINLGEWKLLPLNWKAFSWIDADIGPNLLLDLGSHILIVAIDEEKHRNLFTSNVPSTILTAWFLFTTLTLHNITIAVTVTTAATITIYFSVTFTPAVTITTDVAIAIAITFSSPVEGAQQYIGKYCALNNLNNLLKHWIRLPPFLSAG